MRKSYDAILTRDIEVTITMRDLNGSLMPETTKLLMRAGRFVFKKARKRDEWVAAINAEHPGASRAAHV